MPKRPAAKAKARATGKSAARHMVADEPCANNDASQSPAPRSQLGHCPPRPSSSSGSSDSTSTSALVSSDSSERGSSILTSPTDIPGRDWQPPAPPPSASGPFPRHFASLLMVCAKLCLDRSSANQLQARTLPRGTRLCCKMLVRAALRCPCHFQLLRHCPLRSQSATRPSSTGLGPTRLDAHTSYFLPVLCLSA